MKKNKQIALSTLRAAKGMSQRTLAKELHLSPGLIGLYESGKRKPSLDNAILISSYFSIPLEKLSFANPDKIS